MSAPTFARPGNSCGKAGSYVVGSPECGHIALDEVDDVDWSGGVYSCFREGAQVVRQREGISALRADDPPRSPHISSQQNHHETTINRGSRTATIYSQILSEIHS